MSIRLPLRTVMTSSIASPEVGGSSVSGGIPLPFVIPQDTDNVVVKFAASLVGGISATFQTTDDGGTTWYDVARTSTISNSPAGFEEWLNIPVSSPGINPMVKSTANSGSILGGAIGSSAASALGQKTVSGMPLLSPTARVFLIITGNITDAAANLITTKVLVNSQSATA